MDEMKINLTLDANEEKEAPKTPAVTAQEYVDQTLSALTDEEKQNLPDREYITWAEGRPLCFQILKGKKLPVSFKLVLMDPDRPEEADRLINIRYEHDQLTLITSVSFKTFTRNRDLEQEWDTAVYHLLSAHDIDAEEE